jgi:hypothetical protein
MTPIHIQLLAILSFVPVFCDCISHDVLGHLRFKANRKLILQNVQVSSKVTVLQGRVREIRAGINQE